MQNLMFLSYSFTI